MFQSLIQLLGLMMLCGTVLMGLFLWALNQPEGKMRDCCLQVGGWALAALCAFYVVSPVDCFPVAFLPIDDFAAAVAGIKAAWEAIQAGRRQAARAA
jgi:hypothetical protein